MRLATEAENREASWNIQIPTRSPISTISRKPFFLVLLALALAGACLLALGRRANRPINPPLPKGQARDEQRFEGMEWNRGEHEDLVILAFSGGGTRAAAFSYGVLEALRDIEVTTSSGRKIRMLDEVDVITGVGWKLHRTGIRAIRGQAV